MKIILCLILVGIIVTRKPIHEVIVIGAGLAGIGASKVLTQNRVSHMLIEARDRIGGRVASVQFEGATVQLGGLLLHSPKKCHPILEVAKNQLNWPLMHGGYAEQEGYYYQNGGQISEEYIERLQKLQKEIILDMLFRSKLSKQDISVGEAARIYFDRRLKGQKQIVKDLLKWMVEEYGNIQGSDIKRLSARMIRFDETPDDLLPVGGYAKLVEAIFSLCKPDLRLKQKVLEIDYSQQFVKVVTNLNIHYGSRVISSLPLGVIQAETVRFIPQMPQQYKNIIQKLDPGVHEKVIVSFQEPFWNPQHKWLSLVRKNQVKSMYQMAHVLSSQEGKHLLMLFISGDDGRALLNFSDQELRNNLTDFFSLFSNKRPVIEKMFRTNWLGDQLTKGAYVSFPVGVDRQSLNILHKPLDEKVWIVGQYTHPELKSLTHGAFLTGIEAAKDVISRIR